MYICWRANIVWLQSLIMGSREGRTIEMIDFDAIVMDRSKDVGESCRWNERQNQMISELGFTEGIFKTEAVK